MDIFFHCAPVEKKRRAHFHKFMLEVHERLHAIRKKGKGRADVTTVAEDMVREGGSLLCFDEFNVTDVGDAVILRTLFDRMWECGAVVVTTSNR
jgi:predicted ATPase